LTGNKSKQPNQTAANEVTLRVDFLQEHYKKWQN
jgi:hypothetical protein